MNLWLRIIWLLLTSPMRRSASFLDTTKIGLVVLPNDLDINGHVNNGRYLTLADLGRLDFCMRTGVLRAALALHAMPVVGDAFAKFRKELWLFQRYDIETRLLGWDEKWSFVEQRFVSNGRVVGVVILRCLFRKASGLVKTAEILEALGIREQSPALPGWLIDWNKSCEDLGERLRDGSSKS